MQISGFQSTARPYMERENKRLLAHYKQQTHLRGRVDHHFLHLRLLSCELTLDELSSLTTTAWSPNVSQQFRRFGIESIPDFYDYVDKNGAYVDFANYQLGGAVFTYGLVIVPSNASLTRLTVNYQSVPRGDTLPGIARASGISDC